jgi:hypothetical protein
VGFVVDKMVLEQVSLLIIILPMFNNHLLSEFAALSKTVRRTKDQSHPDSTTKRTII